MKTLYLIRHAKAINPEAGLPDFERSLEKRGKSEAKEMAKRLRTKGIKPDLLISSPANRALETAHIFAKELRYPVQKIMLKDPIYNVPTEEVLLEVVQGIEDKYNSVMLFGHNPSLNDFAIHLLKNFKEDLPTCGVVCMDFRRNSWKKVSQGAGFLKFFDFPIDQPKKLPGYEKIQKDLEVKVIEQLEEVFKEVDLGATKELEKSLKKAGKKLTKRFIKLLKTPEVKEIDRGKKV